MTFFTHFWHPGDALAGVFAACLILVAAYGGWCLGRVHAPIRTTLLLALGLACGIGLFIYWFNAFIWSTILLPWPLPSR